MTTNPWQSRFDGLDRHEIRKRFEHIPEPVDPERCADRAELDSKIKAALAALAIPASQSVGLCYLIVARARAHAAAVYPNAREFLYQCYRKDGPNMPDENFPICLTGPAGIGKTTLVRRMQNVFPVPTTIAVDTGNRTFPVVSAWYLSVKDCRTVSDMLRRLIVAAGGTPCGKSIDALARQCRRLAYEFGICMLFVDELQFLTKSQNATARIIDAIYELMGLGVPVTIVANYSLVTSLKRRPQQDRQRVLGNTQIIYHEPARSPDWTNLVHGVVKIAPAVMRFEPEKHSIALHNLTGGTPRMLAFLVTAALSDSRAARPEITFDDLQAAYESPEFSVCRGDIELLNQQLATGEKARQDLWPPIRVPLEPQAELQRAAQDQALSETARKLVEDYLTPSQLALLDELKSRHHEQAGDDTVVPIGEKAQPKISDFEVGESIFKKIRTKR